MKVRYLQRKEAAKYLTEELGLPTANSYLQKLATVGGGPEYQRFGKYAVYTQDALDTYAASKLSAPRGSTSASK
jgi:hypothetical protein